MARYIDADKLIDDLGLRKGITIDEIINGIPEKGIRPMDEPHCWFFLSIILAPTADVQPVVKGEWIEDGAVMKCSVCGNSSDYCGTENFCNYCGADMRER